MSYYIYRYIHPDYAWLYVGQTVDIKGRIKSHDYSNTDNIDREYTDLLQEATVLYFECNSKNQMNYIESYLIDKYKPFLNKAGKDIDVSCEAEMKLPDWRVYRQGSKDFNTKLSAISDEIETKTSLLSDINFQLDSAKKELLEIRKDAALLYDLKRKTEKEINSSIVKRQSVDKKFIADFYEAFPNSNISFSANVWGENGERAMIIYGNGFMEISKPYNKKLTSKDLLVQADNPHLHTKAGQPNVLASFYLSMFEILNNGLYPSSPSFFSLLNGYYSNQIAKIIQEIEEKHKNIKVFKLHEINKEGCYYLCDEFGNFKYPEAPIFNVVNYKNNNGKIELDWTNNDPEEIKNGDFLVTNNEEIVEIFNKNEDLKKFQEKQRELLEIIYPRFQDSKAS